MKVDRKIFIFTFAVLALALGGSLSASAQGACNSTVPDYSPDFTSNQSCLAPFNGTPANSGYPGFYPPAIASSQPIGTPNPAQPVPTGVSTVLRLTPNSTYTSGSAWFNTPQPVSANFTTSFMFQLSGASNSEGPADGIAFVIQNSGTSALGPDGCGLGFGDVPEGTCAPTSGGIASSLAVEFDSYQNPTIGDVSSSHVAIQSCLTGPNSVDASCRLQIPSPSGGTTPADVNLLALQNPINLADGNFHSATISYVTLALSTQTNCGGGTASAGPCLDVMLDGVDLFPAGVPFDITTIGLTSGTAYVGFTAGTGLGDDNQDILSWTFSPQGQTQTLQPGVPATYPFQNDAYSYTATLAGTQPATTTTVTPIYTTLSACNGLVQETYKGAQCFVYTNLGPNIPDSAVMFEVTCPDLPYDQCNPFSAVLGTTYTLSTETGNNFNPIDPYPGWLKGAGPDYAHPCTPPSSGPLFLSDQVISFSLDTSMKGGSGGTGSCWVATFDQPDQALSAITIASPANNSIFAQGANVPATYTCANPTTSQLSTSPVGPYLTAASCTQSSGTPATCTPSATGLSCTGGKVNTQTPGTYTFTVTATDTGLNQSTQAVTYTVVAPTNLQIVNLGPGGPIGTGGDITYAIGVADIGPANADGVIVTDPLPSNTKFVSGSGTNVNCGIVNKKLSCSTTAIPCSAVGNTVTCNVGTLAPLAISDLNVGTLAIKVQVTGEPTTTCSKTPCTINTATVSAINTDTNSNPSSTVDTKW